MSQLWYIRVGSSVTGPFRSGQIRSMAQSGAVCLSAEISQSPQGPWMKVKQIKGIISTSQQVSDTKLPSSSAVHYSSSNPAHPLSKWYLARDGHTFGPYSLSELQALLARQQLFSTDHLNLVGSREWVAVTSLAELQAEIPSPPFTQPSENEDLGLDEQSETEKIVYKLDPHLIRTFLVGGFMLFGAVLFLVISYEIIPTPNIGMFGILGPTLSRVIATILGLGWGFFGILAPLNAIRMSIGNSSVILTQSHLDLRAVEPSGKIPWDSITNVKMSPMETQHQLVGYVLWIYSKEGGSHSSLCSISSTLFQNESQFDAFTRDVLRKTKCSLELKPLPMGWLAKIDAQKFEDKMKDLVNKLG